MEKQKINITISGNSEALEKAKKEVQRQTNNHVSLAEFINYILSDHLVPFLDIKIEIDVTVNENNQKYKSSRVYNE